MNLCLWCGPDFIQFIHKVNFPWLKIKLKMHNANYIFFLYFFSEMNLRIFMIILDWIEIWLVIKCISQTPFSLLLIHFKFSTHHHPTTISPPLAHRPHLANNFLYQFYVRSSNSPAPDRKKISLARSLYSSGTQKHKKFPQSIKFITDLLLNFN